MSAGLFCPVVPFFGNDVPCGLVGAFQDVGIGAFEVEGLNPDVVDQHVAIVGFIATDLVAIMAKLG